MFVNYLDINAALAIINSASTNGAATNYNYYCYY